MDKSPKSSPRSLKVVALAIASGLVVAPAAWLLLALKYAAPEAQAQAHAATPAVQAPVASKESQAKPQPEAASRPLAAPRLTRPEPAWRGALTAADKKVALARSLEQTNPARARQLLKEALSAEPDHERALRMLATKMLTDEKYGDAQRLSQRCTALNPTNYTCTKVNQLTPFGLGAFFATLKTADECLKKSPNNVACLFLKFELSMARGDQNQARQMLARLTRVDEKSGFVTLARGRMIAASGAYAEARVLLEQACAAGVELSCFRAEILRAEGF
jgi:hypothetical protein